MYRVSGKAGAGRGKNSSIKLLERTKIRDDQIWIAWKRRERGSPFNKK